METLKKARHRILENPLLLSSALLVAAVLILLSVNFITRQPDLRDGATVVVRIDRAQLQATVAASETARVKGLSGTRSLGANRGMLFVRNATSLPAIVMRDMNYPIDIIWISQGTVSEVTAGVQPQPGVADDQLTQYRPSGPADRILETGAGWAAKHGVQPGDPVRISGV